MTFGDPKTLNIESVLDLIRGQTVNPIPMPGVNFPVWARQSVDIEDDLELTSSGSWISAKRRKNEHVKQYVINEASEDLLALSVCWHRIRTSEGGSPSITSLTDTALFGCVKEEDRVQANVIRDHFSKKIMMWALKEVKLTPFRVDLSSFIHSTGKLFTDETLPLVFRLPEFYAYDVAFVELKTSFSPIPEHVHHSASHLKLIPVKNLNRKLKSGYKHEYWFKDQDNRAYLILIDHLNVLKSLWNREFLKEHVLINAIMTCKLEQDEVTYFKLAKWQVE